MQYTILANAAKPALVIYLIDVSGSMGDELEGNPKIEHVNQAIEQVLKKMVQRSLKGETLSPRYKLMMIAYSDDCLDVLGGVKSIKEVVKIGSPKLSATNSTNTAKAFELALKYLRQLLPKLDGFPAPMICHLTDGNFTDEDPYPIAYEIMQMGNNDGNVLIENIYVGPNLTKQPITDVRSWPGIMSVSELSDPYVQKLFHMSSALPETYAKEISQEGYNLKPGCKMLIPGTNKKLIELAFTMSSSTPTRVNR